VIDRIDHLVLTVRDLAATVDFYTRGLGMRHEVSKGGRHAVVFGRHKINLHEAAAEPILPRAGRPTPGSGDFCLIADRPLDRVVEHLGRERIAVEEGPVERSGAAGRIRSVYLRDPDGNLVEISEYP
jgi:catechol 2,3-dioxygenase-like lactoylglutathione lyase family enzyme